jgi:hypothetical protein
MLKSNALVSHHNVAGLPGLLHYMDNKSGGQRLMTWENQAKSKGMDEVQLDQRITGNIWMLMLMGRLTTPTRRDKHSILFTGWEIY